MKRLLLNTTCNATTGKSVENDEEGYTGTCHLIFRIEFFITYQ